MTSKLNRRQMTIALAGAGYVLAPASGQAQDVLEVAREEIRESIREMEEFDLPMSVEPAFLFKP